MRPDECIAVPSFAYPWNDFSSFGKTLYLSKPWKESSEYATNENQHLPEYIQNTMKIRSTIKESLSTSLPQDPRLWSRDDVAKWVRLVVEQHGLPLVQLDRFLMNGKGLCLMTIDMFVQRVPLGGKLLYKDFQLRLSSALYS